MKTKNILDTSTNRGEFNRAYKAYLEKKGKIHCSYCGYHKNENDTTKHYGGFVDKHVAYPNWKLVSKNSKQWMDKPLKKKVEITRWTKTEYVTFKW